MIFSPISSFGVEPLYIPLSLEASKIVNPSSFLSDSGFVNKETTIPTPAHTIILYSAPM